MGGMASPGSKEMAAIKGKKEKTCWFQSIPFMTVGYEKVREGKKEQKKEREGISKRRKVYGHDEGVRGMAGES